jgi:hypothetical protein
MNLNIGTSEDIHKEQQSFMYILQNPAFGKVLIQPLQLLDQVAISSIQTLN